MPKRTNQFQELVALIEKALAPTGAKIVESAEVSVQGMTTLREVDILIEGAYGPYRMKIAVEAKDEGRRVSLQTVEELIGKYTGTCRVNVDKFVIVSSRGFTAGAVEKAAAADVELLTVAQAKDKKWENVGPRTCSFKLAPHLCRVDFVPKLPVLDYKFAAQKGRLICPKKHDHGPVWQIANCTFFHKWLPKNEAKFREAEAGIIREHKGEGFMTLHLPVNGCAVRLGGIDHPVEEIGIVIHLANQQGSVTHKAYERASTKGDTQVMHHIEAVAGRKKFEFVFGQGGLTDEQKHGVPEPLRDVLPGQIVLKIGDVNPAVDGNPKADTTSKQAKSNRDTPQKSPKNTKREKN